jgi:hypothetical protein
MHAALFKKVRFLLLLSLMLWGVACTSTEPWWKGKPPSQMTPAEQEEQDPEFWPMWMRLHGIGN